MIKMLNELISESINYLTIMKQRTAAQQYIVNEIKITSKVHKQINTGPSDVARCEIRTKRTALLRISVPSYPDGPSELTDILGSGFSYCPVSQVTCQGVDNCGGLVNP